MPGRADYVGTIAEGRDRLLEHARLAGRDVAVPSARRWAVRDLVVHVGNVHEWARSVLTRGIEQEQVFDAEPVGIGDGFDDLLHWYAGCADALLDLLVSPELRDEAPVWTFGPPGSTSAFWPRRQAHEVTMHAVDAALAAGVAVSDALLPLDAEMSGDGVDEVLTVMMPRVALFVPRPTLSGRLAIVASDVDRQWVIDPDGQIATAATVSDAASCLVGPAASIFATLWRRASLEVDGAELGVTVGGDPAVVDALFAARLTP